MTKNYFMRAYNLADDEVEVDTIALAPPASAHRPSVDSQLSGMKADFSEQIFAPVRLDYADANIDKLAAASQHSVDEWLARLKMVIDNAPNMDALPDLIAREFDNLPTEQLVTVIEQGLIAATLAGRAEVVAEADGALS